MSISAGTRLGPYEILVPIGKRGMGEVWKAHDTRLGRDVAIKISAEQFSERFEREARAVAALNHPNICTLFDVGPNYLVMEYIEGTTLADRIKEGPIPLEEALAMARHVADALDAAHEKNIIHRDLKPGNIKIKPDSTVKVLDFGLAKMGGTPAAKPEDSPTLSMAATQAGMILGTAAYMSPEQARGKEVDKRADIWAFGVVLYEMVTGKKLFEGETITDIIAAVVKEEPDWNQVPVQVRRLLKRCLEKDPKKRLRDIGDWWELLDDAPQAPASGQPTTRSHGHSGWIAAVILLVALGVVSFIHFRERPSETAVLRTTILRPDNTAVDFTNGHGLPALSPDGRKIVFGARTADGKTPLWVRSLDALTAQPLAGTEGAAFPFWSPDSKFIAFFADGKLKKIDASGGPALTLTDALLGRGGSWSRDGVIVFAPTNASSGPLPRVSSAGGASAPISGARGRLPWFLPDGRHFLYQGGTLNGPGLRTIRVGSLDGGESKMVTETGSNALYAQGHLLFLRDGTLMAQPFDATGLRITGEAVPVAEQIQSVLNTGTVGIFSVSETGILAYRTGAGVGGVQLTWFDRTGKRLTTIGEPANLLEFQFSPDRKSLAAAIEDRSASYDIWIYNAARGLRTRLTFDRAHDGSPVWSPDGRSIVFGSNLKGHYDLYRKAADGSGAEELLHADNVDKIPTSWSADGKFLLFTALGPKTGLDIWALPLTGDRAGQLQPFPVLQTPFTETEAQFSPDGKWIAYASDESQRAEIYVTAFSLTPSGPGGKRQVSTAGGTRPRWRQDGKEIFYMGLDRRLMAAEVAAKGETIEVGQVRALFGTTDAASPDNPYYDVSADGEHFLLRTFPEQKAGEPLTLMQNWTAGLKK